MKREGLGCMSVKNKTRDKEPSKNTMIFLHILILTETVQPVKKVNTL